MNMVFSRLAACSLSVQQLNRFPWERISGVSPARRLSAGGHLSVPAARGGVAPCFVRDDDRSAAGPNVRECGVDIATSRNIARTRSFFNGYRIRYVPSVTIAAGSVAQITLDCDSKMMALSPQADRRAATWLSDRHFYSLHNPSSRDAAKRRFRFLRRLRRQ
jgi:hypothetical protein